MKKRLKSDENMYNCSLKDRNLYTNVELYVAAVMKVLNYSFYINFYSKQNCWMESTYFEAGREK
ncbi:hypothetical protein COE51_18040 [Bacillus pseudomycoides]|nr:hypothetical protein COE51_18040 [Bacillus pseudomycoides]